MSRFRTFVFTLLQDEFKVEWKRPFSVAVDKDMCDSNLLSTREIVAIIVTYHTSRGGDDKRGQDRLKGLQFRFPMPRSVSRRIFLTHTI